MAARLPGLVLLAIAAAVGFAAGWVGGAFGHFPPQATHYPFLVEYVPLPHHVPEHAGGATFRFAMAHDVIHERFAKHGPAHYRERNQLTRQQLASLAPDDPTTFSLADDLAVGLERLGRSDEAVAVMRDKLARQAALGLTGRDLYTSYANLGTSLMLGSFSKAVAGDADARERFREGTGFVHRSVEVNPEAHFGRERWQEAFAEFILSAMTRPNVLQAFDFLGNRLNLPIEDILNREENWSQIGYGRPTDAAFSQGRAAYELPVFFQPGVQPDDPLSWPELNPIRKHITRVGAEEGWWAVPSHRSPVPFDEPVLGIIGMWRQGGGANPHFALALGETMLRVGQRYIAWAAYERASRMAERFWPDLALQQFLRDHCRKRQQQIEETLAFEPPASARRPAWQHVSPPPGRETVSGLRSSFDDELAHGESYQRAYQVYEAERLAAGVSLTDEHFFEEFLTSREPIASPVGPEEWFASVPPSKAYAYSADRRRAWGVCGAGLAALGIALLLRRKTRRGEA